MLKQDANDRRAESKRNVLARDLEQEQDELDYLVENLHRTTPLTDRMAQMLSGFEQRLARLEGTLMPMQQSTQRLTVLHDNIKATVGELGRLIECFDMAGDEELLLRRGPLPDSVETVETYFKSVRRVDEAVAYLAGRPLKACSGPLAQLRGLVQVALRQSQECLQGQLAAVSEPTDAQNITLAVDTERQAVLQRLCAELDRLERTYPDAAADSPLSPYTRVYVRVRSTCLLKSVEKQWAAAGSTTGGGERRTGQYVRGSAAIIGYLARLLRLMQTERELGSHVVLPRDAQAVFEKTVEPAVAQFLEAAEILVARVRRGVARHDYSDVFVLLDVLSELSRLASEHSAVVQSAGARGADLAEFLASCRAALLGFFGDYYSDQVHPEPVGAGRSAPLQLPPDGTVHEMTSSVLLHLRRLLEYRDAVAPLLAGARDAWVTPAAAAAVSAALASATAGLTGEAPSYSAVLGLLTSSSGRPAQRLRDTVDQPPALAMLASFYTDTIEALAIRLESSARGYSKRDPRLTTLFLLNNYHYLLKGLRSPGNADLLGIVGRATDLCFEKLVKDKRREYQAIWAPALAAMGSRWPSTSTTASDDPSASGNAGSGGPEPPAHAANFPQQLSKAQRQAIKEKFKAVNAEIDAVCSRLVHYAVPDDDLRTQLRTETRRVVLVAYQQFLGQYANVEFTKKREKYVLYDKASLGDLLSRLFEAHSC